MEAIRAAGAHVVELHINQADLLAIVRIATSALAEMGLYRAHMAIYGGQFGRNDEELHRLPSSLAQLEGRLREASHETFDIPPGTRSFVFEPVFDFEQRGTARWIEMRSILQHVFIWLGRFKVQATASLGAYPAIDDGEAGIFADVVARLETIAGVPVPGRATTGDDRRVKCSQNELGTAINGTKGNAGYAKKLKADGVLTDIEWGPKRKAKYPPLASVTFADTPEAREKMDLLRSHLEARGGTGRRGRG